jgi:FtsP/CotA-like multicopper oxidase with cupredoxin domain
MYYLSSTASRARQREAQRARDNRAEIVKALSHGQITRRELYKWGLLTVTGAMVLKNGLSPWARSAFAAVPTGTPRSPLFGVGFNDFTAPLPRLNLEEAVRLTPVPDPFDPGHNMALFPDGLYKEKYGARRSSYHNLYNGDPKSIYTNPVTHVGPIEGRPPKVPANFPAPFAGSDPFAHQRWDGEFFPKVGYVMSWAQCEQPSALSTGTRFHPKFAAQKPNSVWCYGSGANFVNGVNQTTGSLPPFLIQARYGEPSLTRVYNNTPVNQDDNDSGFGRNESQLHFHNAHNGAESDGAANVHHFPGTFYDYRWSTTLARRDKINTDGSDNRASGPGDNGDLVNVAGDWREIQTTMWAHDHRFFFTAENVYKGNLGMVSYYSGRDRGYEKSLPDMEKGPKGSDADPTRPVNLQLPSGYLNAKGWGNRDFDLHLVVSDAATDRDGQLFFDIFDTDGFLGDVAMVNFAYRPYFEVLPRKHRFRILAASMSRFYQLQISGPDGKAVQFQQMANDGNLLSNPVFLTSLDQQGTGERYDIIVDFSKFPVGSNLYLVNTLQQTDGRLPDKQLPLAQAMHGVSADPAVGPLMQFRVVSSKHSVDDVTPDNPDGSIITNKMPDYSKYLAPDPRLQIPIVQPVRTRVVSWGRSGGGDSRGPNGQCTPDCPETASFPWTVSVNGQESHSMNANRISLLIPKPGEIEHWTYVNGGGGWDHPIHLHFEEGVTMNRGGASIPATENLVRKDVWRLRPGGQVQFQVQFGEYGGSYVTHCHNTVHEDFALLMRIQLTTGAVGTPQAAVTPTPNPSAEGVTYTVPDILPEGDPNNGFGSPSQIASSGKN